MKFDLFSWNEAKANVENQTGKGVLRLRCSAPSPLYLSAQGVEALAGYGTAFEVETSEAVTWRLEAPKGVRVFVLDPPRTAVEPEGEVFTNIDRMPHESGALTEVLRASRQLEMQRRSMLQEMRIEAANLRASLRPPSPELIDDEPARAASLEPAPAASLEPGEA